MHCAIHSPAEHVKSSHCHQWNRCSSFSWPWGTGTTSPLSPSLFPVMMYFIPCWLYFLIDAVTSLISFSVRHLKLYMIWCSGVLPLQTPTAASWFRIWWFYSPAAHYYFVSIIPRELLFNYNLYHFIMSLKFCFLMWDKSKLPSSAEANSDTCRALHTTQCLYFISSIGEFSFSLSWTSTKCQRTLVTFFFNETNFASAQT